MAPHELGHGREPGEGRPLVPLDHLHRDVVLQDAALGAEEVAQHHPARQGPAEDLRQLVRPHLRCSLRLDACGQLLRQLGEPGMDLVLGDEDPLEVGPHVGSVHGALSLSCRRRSVVSLVNRTGRGDGHPGARFPASPRR